MLAKTFCLFLVILSFSAVSLPVMADSKTAQPDKDYQQYTDFFEKVYKTFEDNYYLE